MDPAIQELLEGEATEEIEAIVKLRDGQAKIARVRPVVRFGPIMTCRVERQYLQEVWSHPDVVSLKAPRLLAAEAGIIDLEAAQDLEVRESDRRRPDLAVSGRGVVVGLVDMGCDFAHPHFLQGDGRTRLLALWDQSAREGSRQPQPYDYGAVFTREDLNRALKTAYPYGALGYHPARADPMGIGAHGTCVLDIAAGNGRVPGAPVGLAPDADLIFVHASSGSLSGQANLGDSVRILEALDFINRTADGRPWVVNVSLGRRGGAHDGLSLVEQGMDALLLEAPGRAIVLSTGNYFGSRAHAAGQLRPNSRRTLRWWVDAADCTPNELEIWYSGKDAFNIELIAPDAGNTWEAALGEKKAITLAGRKVGHLYHRVRDPNNGDHHVDIFLHPGAPGGCWKLRITGVDVVDGKFDAWVERDVPCPRCESSFDARDVETTSTTGTICNGFRTIAVGGYDAHSADREIGGFSSSGPTRDHRQKPDLVAPGVRVLAARSAAKSEVGETPWLTRMSGTSFAAPHVTGTIALMFEAAGEPLPIQETRRLLLGSTQRARELDGGQVRIGSGYLDIEGAVTAVGQRFGPSSGSSEIQDEALGPLRSALQGGEMDMSTYEEERWEEDVAEEIPEEELFENARKYNFILVSGGPGPYNDKDPEHDRSWSNYIDPPLLMSNSPAKRQQFSTAEEEVWWFVFRPAYAARWASDLDDKKRHPAIENVKKLGAESYRHLIEMRARERGWNLRWFYCGDGFWTQLETLAPDSISRLYYWGHASGDLWLNLRHDAAGQAVEPLDFEIIKQEDISNKKILRNRFLKGDLKRVDRFVGCNTNSFAAEWAKTFQVWAEGVTGKVWFVSLSQTGGKPCLSPGAASKRYGPKGQESSSSYFGNCTELGFREIFDEAWDESESFPTIAEQALNFGRIQLQGEQHPVNPRTAKPEHAATNLDTALQYALAQRGPQDHTFISGNMLTAKGFLVYRWGPAKALPTPVVAECQGMPASPGVATILINGGKKAYFPADPIAPSRRWVEIPRLREFYAMPDQWRNQQLSAWRNLIWGRITQISIPGVTLTEEWLKTLSMPALRLLLAHFGSTLFPVNTINPTKKKHKGGQVQGITRPLFQYPLKEPECYVPVLSGAEGKMEAINAWDTGAGVSLGPIQFNVIRGAIFRFLWNLLQQDNQLFQQRLGTPLNWTMLDHNNHYDLIINAGTPQVITLHGTGPETKHNSAYFQSGDINKPNFDQIDQAFRINIANHFRDLVIWPHVQEIIMSTLEWWLHDGLTIINRSTLPLDPLRPDQDNFILKSLLISAYVRYSGLVDPILTQLGQWATIREKLINWEQALAKADFNKIAENIIKAELKRAKKQLSPQELAQRVQVKVSKWKNELQTRLRGQQSWAGTVFTSIQELIRNQPSPPRSGVRTQPSPPRSGEGLGDSDWAPEAEIPESMGDLDFHEPTMDYTPENLPESWPEEEPGEYPGEQFVAAEEYPTIVEMADQAISGQESFLASGALLYEVLTEKGLIERLYPLNRVIGNRPSPELLYSAFAPNGAPALRESFGRIFELVAGPGERLDQPLREGDFLVRIAPGEPGLGHLAVVTSPELVPAGELSAAGLTGESSLPGRYAHVVEAGYRPHTLADSYARMVLDADERMLEYQMALRLLPEAIGDYCKSTPKVIEKLVTILRPTDEATLRAAFVANAESLECLEAGDPNHEATWNEILGINTDNKKWPLNYSYPGKKGRKGISTCGLVAEGIWRRMGVVFDKLYLPYVDATAMRRALDFARSKNARKVIEGSKEKGYTRPKEGDYVYIYVVTKKMIKGELKEVYDGHVFTCIGWEKDANNNDWIVSIDGGQVSTVYFYEGQSKQFICRRKRRWDPQNKRVLQYYDDDPSKFEKYRSVGSWVDISKLPYYDHCCVPEKWANANKDKVTIIGECNPLDLNKKIY